MNGNFAKALTALLAVSLVACSAPGLSGLSVVEPGIAQSAKPRIVSMPVEADELQELVAGNNAFAFDLYDALRGTNGNLFYSPYSISLALAMAYAGASGDTAQQMADVLHLALQGQDVHTAFNALDQYLASLDDGTKGRDDGGFRLKIANAIWGQQDYKFLQAFLDLLAENYGAGLRLVDFKGATEQSRQAINDWVAEQTEQKIKDLLPPGSIDAMTRLVLTNAVYFNAAWANPFDENATIDAPFYLLDGSDVTVKMMRQTEHFGYALGDGYQAVEIPYAGGKMSMAILLPDDGNFQQFEDSLNGEQVDAILQNLSHGNVMLSLPKFEFSSEFGLADVLRQMGMSAAFDPAQADFSAMDGTHDLFIGDVFHKAYISVNEAGTEAAAATAVVMKASGMPLEPVKITVDRPFMFLIRDTVNNSTLFVGRVMNPAA
jgi:serpin B